MLRYKYISLSDFCMSYRKLGNTGFNVSKVCREVDERRQNTDTSSKHQKIGSEVEILLKECL